MQPIISIIMFAYNRCDLLKLAIQSVQRQTFKNWEIWVFAAACTDETERGVAAFKDPRIHFVSLENQGDESSYSNNEGFRLSRGAYIAYLHHDDLWRSDHLETVLAGIKNTRADLVFTLTDIMMRSGAHHLSRTAPAVHPGAWNFIPESSWFFRRELLEEISPLRFATECPADSSQEWLVRAHRANKNIRLIWKMTVISFHRTIFSPQLHPVLHQVMPRSHPLGMNSTPLDVSTYPSPMARKTSSRHRLITLSAT